ncbi:MAG: helix-turn-helix transcriptional regulator [Lachnospiraceae bacterium]|nr:helix-turn-helix transcriptional regulator [Lachnospiraceae bacterium]
MKVSKKKYELAKARACMSSTDIIKAGISKGTLANILNGEVLPQTVGKLAKILGVDVTEIIE